MRCVCVFMCLVILIQLRLVTDRRTEGRTDRHVMIANTALAQRSEDKIWNIMTCMHPLLVYFVLPYLFVMLPDFHGEIKVFIDICSYVAVSSRVEIIAACVC